MLPPLASLALPPLASLVLPPVASLVLPPVASQARRVGPPPPPCSTVLLPGGLVELPRCVSCSALTPTNPAPLLPKRSPTRRRCGHTAAAELPPSLHCRHRWGAVCQQGHWWLHDSHSSLPLHGARLLSTLPSFDGSSASGKRLPAAAVLLPRCAQCPLPCSLLPFPGSPL